MSEYKDRAYWLADKIPACGDYAHEASVLLRKQSAVLELATTTLRIIAANPANYLVPEYLAAEILRQIDEFMK